jgi:predicted metal-binding protein
MSYNLKHKKMKKITKTLIVALIVTVSAFGQQRGGHGGSRGGQGSGERQGPPAAPTTEEIEEMVSDLSKELLLSSDQQAEIQKIYTSHFKAVAEKTSAGRPDRDEMDTLKKEFEKEVKAVLTIDQQELYTAYMKNKRSENGKKE